MATIRELCRLGELIPITVPLKRFEHDMRFVYASPECRRWFDKELRNLIAVDSSNLPPRQQFAMLLKDFITGKSFDHPRDFRRLRPVAEDVYELKTPDLRVFGWFPVRDTYIAVTACCLDEVKSLNIDRPKFDPYLRFIELVINYREKLDMDEPKYTKGAGYYDVISI